MEYRSPKKLIWKVMALALAKATAGRDLYEREKRIYRLVRSRNKATKDINQMKQIKDPNRVLQTGTREMEGVFWEPVAQENARDHEEDGIPFLGLEFSRENKWRKLLIKGMKNNTASGQDKILVWAQRTLEDRVDLLNLMCKVKEQKEIPDEWKESVLVPIFKMMWRNAELGDFQ